MMPLQLSIAPVTPMTATEFISSLANVDRFKREILAEQALLTGNVPDYMTQFLDVNITFTGKLDGKQHKLTIYVLPDYLTIGTRDDHIRIPLFPTTAQRICNAWNCTLPTPSMVNTIWYAASGMNRLVPQTWGPPYDASMFSTERFVKHNQAVEAQIKKKLIDYSKLVVGHAKDVVISVKMIGSEDKVLIYGWHKLDGKPIQNLNWWSHETHYVDYSHGIRLVLLVCLLDDKEYDLRDVLRDPNLCLALSSEGPVVRTEYPTA